LFGYDFLLDGKRTQTNSCLLGFVGEGKPRRQDGGKSQLNKMHASTQKGATGMAGMSILCCHSFTPVFIGDFVGSHILRNFW
jgi:hypothetical protein